MRYFRAYQYIFDSSNWFQNFLLASLCMLIPVIGPLVVSGYYFEIVEALHLWARARGTKKEDDAGEDVARPVGRAYGIIPSPRQASQGATARPDPSVAASYPDFDFNRFSEYLVRGIWPFLVNLIVGLPFGLFIGFLWGLGIVTLASTSGDNFGPVLAVFFALVVLAMIANFMMIFVLLPLNLRAGLGQDFAGAFSWEFFRDFLARVWWETLLAQLFMFVTSLPLMFVGLLACYVGLFPAVVITAMAQHHLYYQLYELYLERGGAPIPLKIRNSAVS